MWNTDFKRNEKFKNKVLFVKIYIKKIEHKKYKILNPVF